MNYERLQQKDKKVLIELILGKDKLLREFEEKFLKLEKIGRISLDHKEYWLWRERIK